MGQRMWQRGLVEGNSGNLALRVADDLVICTPTQISKGFMRPEDLSLVDLEGRQLLGARRRTSEISMHLEMMKRQPKAVATCHGHPAHATAFAMTGKAPPRGLLSEFELMCSVGVASYRSPGSTELGRVVAALTDQHNVVLMANHGVVTWSHRGIEEALWILEAVEACCRTFVVAKNLGKRINTLTGHQIQELLNIKKSLGFVDPRYTKKK